MRAARHGRDRRWWFAGTATVLVCLLLTAPMLAAQDVRRRVGQILNSPQRSGGAMVEQLVQLGTPAVPALVEELDTYRFPMVILEALGRIGDQSAAVPVLAFLNRIAADPERQEERLRAIAILRDLGDTRAETTLHLLVSDEKVQLATRLAAASALAKWGSPPVRQEASAFIMKTARNWRPEITSRADVLDDALAAVGSDESQAVLIARLDRASLAAEQSRIIRLLGRRPTPQVAASLLAFCERQDWDAYIRLRAAKALVEAGMEFPRERLSLVVEQIRKALPAELQPEAEQLRKRIGP